MEQAIRLIQEFSQNVIENTDLQNILQDTIEIVSQIAGGDSCFVYFIDEAIRQLVLIASRKPYPKMLGNIKLKLGEGVTGWVAAEKKPVVIERDASKDPRFKLFPQLPEDKFSAILSVPIMGQGRVLGVINVQHRYPHIYPDQVVTFVYIIANILGNTIEKIMLLEKANLLEEALEGRKLIERAKGILMKKHGLEEAEAYRLLQKQSMDMRRPMKEFAKKIIFGEI